MVWGQYSKGTIWYGGNVVEMHGIGVGGSMVWGQCGIGYRGNMVWVKYCGHRWPTCSVPPAQLQKTAIDAISGQTGGGCSVQNAPKLHLSHPLHPTR